MAGDEMVCPITHELPFDPVMADDGFVYERSAIEAHIARQTTAHPSSISLFSPDSGTSRQRVPGLRSPMTNAPMGARLLPSVQIKNLIETLIENRSITGDLAAAWKRKSTEKKTAERWLTAAQNGDADAMFKVYQGSRHGQNGFKKDLALALDWLKLAYNSGSKEALADWGLALLRGYLDTMKVPPQPNTQGLRAYNRSLDREEYSNRRGLGEYNIRQGLGVVALAAARGNSDCAFVLGRAYARGNFGLVVDKIQAALWIQMALENDCAIHKMPDDENQEARSLLDELKK